MLVLESLDAGRLPERPAGDWRNTSIARRRGEAVAFTRLVVAAMLFIRLPRFHRNVVRPRVPNF